MSAFPQLFSAFAIAGCEIRNRIFSTGHQTLLVTGGIPGPAFAAYHEARARGGAGLIITEACAVHETAYFNAGMATGYRDEVIPGFRLVTDAVHRHGARIFGQLFHPGAEVFGIGDDGTRPIAWAPSELDHERYFVTTRPLSDDQITDIVAGYGATAVRMVEGGYDGVEIVGSHGYLPAQFLSARLNRRTDRWGGSRENRERFILEVARRVRAAVPKGTVLGLRISLDEKDHVGMNAEESLAALQSLAAEGLLDYVNVTLGSSASTGSTPHIVPHMWMPPGYMREHGATVRKAVRLPLLLAGRFNQPQTAEAALVAGEADMIGMTRAQICDPEMANKAKAGRADDIRACIACNQACIGHLPLGVPISCIQHPETGRELVFGQRTTTTRRRRILVAGGGPAGMKAAAVAAERGHEVILCEAAPRLGGQALLAQQLPGRAEFGGIVTNLEREMALAGVTVRLNTPVTRALVEAERPDAVVVATGARPHVPQVDGIDGGHAVTAWQVLSREANCGGSVVVADWRADWIGVGIAEMLALEGRRVRLMTIAPGTAYNLQPYVRDRYIGALAKLGVGVTHHARLAGVDEDTAYFEQTTTGEAIIAEDTDTVVLALGHRSEDGLLAELAGLGIELHGIGDAMAPRTAEEAVLDGLKVATAL